MLSRSIRASSRASSSTARTVLASQARDGLTHCTHRRSQSGSWGAKAAVAVAFSTAAAVYAAQPTSLEEEAAKVETPKFTVRPRVLFVLGGPGAGKGTQCERLVKDCGFTHLSAGELLRTEMTSGSPVGELIANYIKDGRIVPVEITVGLLGKAMIAAGTSKFLIDGFPRNENNLQGWIRVMGDAVDVDGVLFYDVDDETRLGRLLERGKTSGRTDDNAETIKKRFRVFESETMPIVKHYEAQGKVFHLDGAPTPDQVFEATMRSVSPVLKEDVLFAVGRLLDSIDAGDWKTYSRMCASDMSAIEDESHGAVVRGLGFHKFYFDLPSTGPRKSTILTPDIRLLDGQTAVVSYIRAVQTKDGTSNFAETRVMKQSGGEWKCVHFHRSKAGEMSQAQPLNQALSALEDVAKDIESKAAAVTSRA